MKVAEVREQDKAATLKKLSKGVRKMRTEARTARDLTQRTVEAAAKCQVGRAPGLAWSVSSS